MVCPMSTPGSCGIISRGGGHSGRASSTWQSPVPSALFGMNPLLLRAMEHHWYGSASQTLLPAAELEMARAGRLITVRCSCFVERVHILCFLIQNISCVQRVRYVFGGGNKRQFPRVCVCVCKSVRACVCIAVRGPPNTVLQGASPVGSARC